MIVEIQQYHQPKVYTRHPNMYILSHYRVYYQEFTLWLAILSTNIHTHIIIIPGTEITHTHTLGHDWCPVDTPNLFTQKEWGAYSKVVMWFQPVMPYKFYIKFRPINGTVFRPINWNMWLLFLSPGLGWVPPTQWTQHMGPECSYVTSMHKHGTKCTVECSTGERIG